MARRAQASGYPILKVKLGGGRNEEIVSVIRQATDATLCVDANVGWSRDEAAHLLPRLAEQGVELVEQPLVAADIEGLRWLRKRMQVEAVKIPSLADESVRTSRDVAGLAGAEDGVVIKLMKTKGLDYYGARIILPEGSGLGALSQARIRDSEQKARPDCAVGLAWPCVLLQSAAT